MEAYRAPRWLRGYRDTDDYWTRASSKGGLTGVRSPTLVLNAQNDPFLPRRLLAFFREHLPPLR